MLVITEKRLLQICVAAACCIPLGAGFWGMLLGSRFLDATALNLPLDSHVRYLSGLLFAIGLSFARLIPNLEHRTAEFRQLTFLVVIGGLARLLGLLLLGFPGKAMLFGLMMELLITPLLCLWQQRLAQRQT